MAALPQRGMQAPDTIGHKPLIIRWGADASSDRFIAARGARNVEGAALISNILEREAATSSSLITPGRRIAFEFLL
jgi:hypothetical protein